MYCATCNIQSRLGAWALRQRLACISRVFCSIDSLKSFCLYTVLLRRFPIAFVRLLVRFSMSKPLKMYCKLQKISVFSSFHIHREASNVRAGFVRLLVQALFLWWTVSWTFFFNFLGKTIKVSSSTIVTPDALVSEKTVQATLEVPPPSGMLLARRLIWPKRDTSNADATSAVLKDLDGAASRSDLSFLTSLNSLLAKWWKIRSWIRLST